MKKINSEIMKNAHKLTREIKAEYPNVDYKFQLGLCIKYLLEEDNKTSKRAIELSKTLHITMHEAEELELVEKHYQEEYSENENISFKIWEGYGKRRAYISLPWRSRNANSFKNNYDFGTKYLQDRYCSKQF